MWKENEEQKSTIRNECWYGIFQEFQNCHCFHSSIKTEAVLFFSVRKYRFLKRGNFIFKYSISKGNGLGMFQ